MIKFNVNRLNMKKIILGICLLCSFNSVWAGMIDDVVQRGTLRVGLDPTYMPFDMTNKQGDIVGFEVDLVKAMAKSLGVKLEIVSIAQDGVIPGLLTNKFDMIASGLSLTQERNLKVNFPDPFIMTGQTILIRKDLEGTIKSYKDLNDPKYKVTSRLGTTGEFAAKRRISKAQYFGYNTEAEAVLEVVNGKADAFVFDAAFNVVAVQKLGNGKLVFLDEPFTYEPLAFAIRKGDYDSINWINNFLAQVKNDGTYDRLYNKWFKRTDWLKGME